MSKTILFFGTDTFSAAALTALINADYTIGAVITKPDSKQGRGQKLTAPLVKQIALQHNIPVWQPNTLVAIADDIKALGEVTGVLSSYGKIIPQSILDLFTPGIINVHPSLLPLYRGPSPIESAIENGDAATGVSIMKLVAAMDAGPVYAQATQLLTGTETQVDLYGTLAEKGGELLIATLPQIISGELEPIEQADAATYSQLLKKEDAYIDVSSVSAKQAEQTIRAHLSYPKTKLVVHEQTIIVTQAHVAPEATSSLDQQCQDGNYLIIDQLIAPSGKQMSAEAFLNGYAAG